MTIELDQLQSKSQSQSRARSHIICKKFIIIAVFGIIIFGASVVVRFMVDLYLSTPNPVRLTSNGPVQGIERISSLGQKYYSFRGIPYAAPPITGIDPFTGESVDRRFKATEPLTYIWTEPLKAYKFSRMCMQPTADVAVVAGPIGEKSEDCLYLNIYVPAGGAAKKTVLVYIHGGAFYEGDARDDLYGPDFLLSQDNILVTIQYRLGIFGFLNLGTYPYTGNMGLKDQQQALKWIHTNIEHFSGRNDQILLFGQSAGGTSVHFQMLNTESRKYFNRVFALSGSALIPVSIRKEHQMQHIQECSQSNDATNLIEYLKKANVSVLDKCFEIKSPFIFQPTIESASVVGAFLTKTPEEIYKSNEAPAMDTMFSLTTQESLSLNTNYYKAFDPKELFKKYSPSNKLQVFKELTLLLKAYFSNTSPATIEEKRANFFSDFLFGYGSVKSVALQTQTNYNAAVTGDPKKTFLFRFDVHTPLNLVALAGLEYVGATHCDDLCYSFHCHMLDATGVYETALTTKDLSYDIIMRSVKMITNFARTGDPSVDLNTILVASNPNQIFHGVVSNAKITYVRTDIKKQIHYDTWTQVKNIYEGLNSMAEHNYEALQKWKIKIRAALSVFYGR